MLYLLLVEAATSVLPHYILLLLFMLRTPWVVLH